MADAVMQAALDTDGQSATATEIVFYNVHDFVRAIVRHLPHMNAGHSHLRIIPSREALLREVKLSRAYRDTGLLALPDPDDDGASLHPSLIWLLNMDADMSHDVRAHLSAAKGEYVERARWHAYIARRPRPLPRLSYAPAPTEPA
jgi:hypothetical protein